MLDEWHSLHNASASILSPPHTCAHCFEDHHVSKSSKLPDNTSLQLSKPLGRWHIFAWCELAISHNFPPIHWYCVFQHYRQRGNQKVRYQSYLLGRHFDFISKIPCIPSLGHVTSHFLSSKRSTKTFSSTQVQVCCDSGFESILTLQVSILLPRYVVVDIDRRVCVETAHFWYCECIWILISLIHKHQISAEKDSLSWEDQDKTNSVITAVKITAEVKYLNPFTFKACFQCPTVPQFSLHMGSISHALHYAKYIK